MNYVDNTVEGFLRVGGARGCRRGDQLWLGQEIAVGDLARLIIDMVGSRSEIVSDDQHPSPARAKSSDFACLQ